MNNPEGRAKDRILAAAVTLLRRDGLDHVTVRRIADEAEVGVGLINYHFGSKDELIYEAVSSIMGASAALWNEPYTHPEVDPETRLRQLFRESGRIVTRFPGIFQVAVQHEVMEGDFEVPQLVLPLLREIFGQGKRELELRLIAFSLILSMQIALQRPEAFRRYSGLDIFDDDQRELMLDILVNNVLAQKGTAEQRE